MFAAVEYNMTSSAGKMYQGPIGPGVLPMHLQIDYVYWLESVIAYVGPRVDASG
jgi:hypothetical protein